MNIEIKVIKRNWHQMIIVQIGEESIWEEFEDKEDCDILIEKLETTIKHLKEMKENLPEVDNE